MRFRTALSLASVFVVCFTLAAWARPTPDRVVPGSLAPNPGNQPESGRMSSAVRQVRSIDSLERGKNR